MEMREKFEEKIHVEKDVHHIMTLCEHMDKIHRENDLLFVDNISLEMDMNKYDIVLFFVRENNRHKILFLYIENL